MNHVTVTPEVLESFAATNAAIGAAVATAGAVDAGANIAVMVPVFGLIGQEFLASFIAAQTNHLLAVGSLAAVHAATAAGALDGLAAFESGDAESAAILGSIR